MGGERMRIKDIKALDVQFLHHLVFLDARRQERLVHSRLFAEAWDSADTDERKQILFWLRKIKIEKLNSWLVSRLHKDLENMPIIELRRLASYYRIKNYSRKSRYQLSIEIKEHDRKRFSEQSGEHVSKNAADSSGSGSTKISNKDAVRKA